MRWSKTVRSGTTSHSTSIFSPSNGQRNSFGGIGSALPPGP